MYQKTSSRSAINVQMTGCMSDNKKGVAGKNNSVRTPYIFKCLEKPLTQRPRKSVKCLLQQLNFKTSIYRITEGEKLFPYKAQMQQALHGANKTRFNFFCEPKMFLEEKFSSTSVHMV
jgi:hypothetical protein